MTYSDKKSILPRIWYLLILTAVTVIHVLLTFVVILFVLSTLNIMNNRILHIERLEGAEIIITAVLFTVSLIVFLTSFKKMTRFIKQTLLKNYQL